MCFPSLTSLAPVDFIAAVKDKTNESDIGTAKHIFSMQKCPKSPAYEQSTTQPMRSSDPTHRCLYSGLDDVPSISGSTSRPCFIGRPSIGHGPA